MAVRQILYMGDPRLLAIAESVAAFDTPELHALVRDLLETMQAQDGAGLAAPQIGVGLRVVVFGFDSNTRYPDVDAVPETVLVNPLIKPLSDEKNDDWEACLSVPGLRGVVPRYSYIRYSGFDQQGNVIEREAGDFHARVVQHECDHLNGILYPQRMTDMRLFGFNETLEANGQFTPPPCDTPPE